MHSLDSLAARIARLEVQAEISALITAYAEACDEHDMPRLTAMFTEDAVFTSASGVMEATGRAAIAAMFVGLFKVRGPAYHWTHDHVIRPDPADPDRATGRVYAHAETSPGATHSLAAMRYDDDYRCEGGRWLFARRRIAFLYYVPVAEYAGVLTREGRFAAGDARLPADYPEGLDTWRAFAAAHGPARQGG
jgi:uncharacterized protein (TIGR02246 family)